MGGGSKKTVMCCYRAVLENNKTLNEGLREKIT